MYLLQRGFVRLYQTFQFLYPFRIIRSRKRPRCCRKLPPYRLKLFPNQSLPSLCAFSPFLGPPQFPLGLCSTLAYFAYGIFRARCKVSKTGTQVADGGFTLGERGCCLRMEGGEGGKASAKGGYLGWFGRGRIRKSLRERADSQVSATFTFIRRRRTHSISRLARSSCSCSTRISSCKALSTSLAARSTPSILFFSCRRVCTSDFRASFSRQTAARLADCPGSRVKLRTQENRKTYA